METSERAKSLKGGGGGGECGRRRTTFYLIKSEFGIRC
jgi:hypothetical protein